MAPLYKPSHIEWFSSSSKDKKEQILERQKKFTGSEKMIGINQFLDTEFLLPHTPSINIVCSSPCGSPAYILKDVAGAIWMWLFWAIKNRDIG